MCGRPDCTEGDVDGASGVHGRLEWGAAHGKHAHNGSREVGRHRLSGPCPLRLRLSFSLRFGLRSYVFLLSLCSLLFSCCCSWVFHWSFYLLSVHSTPPLLANFERRTTLIRLRCRCRCWTCDGTRSCSQERRGWASMAILISPKSGPISNGVSLTPHSCLVSCVSPHDAGLSAMLLLSFSSSPILLHLAPCLSPRFCCC